MHLAGGLTNPSDGSPVTVLPKADWPTHQVCETIYNVNGSIGTICIYSNGDVSLNGTGSSAPYTDDEFSSFSPVTFEAGV